MKRHLHPLALGMLALIALCTPLPANELQSFPGCTYRSTEWADGDSFLINLPDGKELSVRLYGVDCLEATIRDDSDARRLRAQRRYFGIAGGPAKPSIELAKTLGKEATTRTAELLAKPFTVHSAFADGRGDARFSRVYAFVTTSDGEDLAAVLVREGLARAYGVTRTTPDGNSSTDYRESLRDIELIAARQGKGIWKHTDWSQLVVERQLEREDDLESALARGTVKSPQVINPNTASRDELMQLPGVGEATALKIIEGRDTGPYEDLQDLERVPGLGKSRLSTLKPWFQFE